MVKARPKRVHINIDKSFYDNIFEPERKKLSLLKGVNFTIPQFTEYLAKRNVKLKFPKNNLAPRKPKKSKINKHRFKIG